MTLTVSKFFNLLKCLEGCDKESAGYYLSISTDEEGEFYPELVTSAVIMEMECSVFNCVI